MMWKVEWAGGGWLCDPFRQAPFGRLRGGPGSVTTNQCSG